MNDIIAEDVEEIIRCGNGLEQFRERTVLIAGANSFRMSYLVYALLVNNKKNNCRTKIVALCRNRARAQERFGEWQEEAGLHLLLQDVRDPVGYGGTVDYCIHAASPAGIRSRQEYPLDTFQANLQGCANLLDFCREKEIKKFMLLSSVDVYGRCGKEGRLKETDIGALDWNYKRNAYACGKRAAETLCTLYHAQYGLPCVIARPFQVYGPGMSLTDGRLHGDIIRQIREKNSILLKSSGTAVRSFMYLKDATLAMLQVLLRGESGGIYNICDEDGECSVYGLAQRYAEAAGKRAGIEFSYDKRDTPEVKEALPAVVGDAARLRALGWKSSTSLKEGICRTMRHYCGAKGEGNDL